MCPHGGGSQFKELSVVRVPSVQRAQCKTADNSKDV